MAIAAAATQAANLLGPSTGLKLFWIKPQIQFRFSTTVASIFVHLVICLLGLTQTVPPLQKESGMKAVHVGANNLETWSIVIAVKLATPYTQKMNASPRPPKIHSSSHSSIFRTFYESASRWYGSENDYIYCTASGDPKNASGSCDP